MRLLSMFQAYLSSNYWRHTFLTFETLKAFLATFGGLWLAVEIITYFYTPTGEALKGYGGWFVGIGVLRTLWKRRPIISVIERLVGRDVELEIRVGDIFAMSGACIVSTNTTFDTNVDSGLISEDSVQGQFTRKFYDSVEHLDHDLKKALVGETEIEMLDGRSVGKSKRYEIGTVAKLSLKGRVFYLVAIAHMNEHGVAQSSFENIKISLATIWEYISRRGGLEPVVMPLIGSGRARITATREELAREIIKSFVAACGAKKFCERLTLVIFADDYRKHGLNIYELDDYLRYICRYTEFKSKSDSGLGVGIG